MLAGILAGLFAGGVLGRLAMRVAGFLSRPERQGDLTSNGNRVGDITLSGTIGLALFAGVSSGILGGVLFAATEPSLRRLRPWHGLTFGVAILLGLGWTVLDPGSIDFLRFGFTPLSLVMFAALFIVYGVAIAWSYDRIRAVIAREGGVARGLEIVVFGAAAGGLAASVAIPIAAGLSDQPLVAALLALLLLGPAFARWRGFPPIVGYRALSIPVIAGLFRFVPALGELVGAAF